MTNASPSRPTPSGSGKRDNDRWWVAGGFYVNRNDPRLFVEKRSGTGWTLNFAHSIAWWLSGGLFVLMSLLELFFFILFHGIISLVLLCVFLALCLLLLIGYLRIRASRQPEEN